MDENRLTDLKEEFMHEYPEFVSFVSTHGRTVATTLLIVLTVTLGIRFYSARELGAIDKAAAALTHAGSIEALENIAVDYKATPSAPLAYMALGNAYFQSGDYDMALSKYVEFQSKFANHPLALSVELNRINCIEARGAVQEAMAGYEAFMKANPKHYLTDEALFGKARCLEKMGSWAEARTVYEDYMVAHPQGIWFPRAEDALKEVDRHIATETAAIKAD